MAHGKFLQLLSTFTSTFYVIMFLIILFKAHNTVSSFLLYANTSLIALTETWLIKDIFALVNIMLYMFIYSILYVGTP